jgi:hypothetical protein
MNSNEDFEYSDDFKSCGSNGSSLVDENLSKFAERIFAKCNVRIFLIS